MPRHSVLGNDKFTLMPFTFIYLSKFYSSFLNSVPFNAVIKP